MLTTEECPEMNVGTGKFSGDVEITINTNQTKKLNPFGKPISLINVFAAPSPYVIYTSTFIFSCSLHFSLQRCSSGVN